MTTLNVSVKAFIDPPGDNPRILSIELCAGTPVEPTSRTEGDETLCVYQGREVWILTCFVS